MNNTYFFQFSFKIKCLGTYICLLLYFDKMQIFHIIFYLINETFEFQILLSENVITVQTVT